MCMHVGVFMYVCVCGYVCSPCMCVAAQLQLLMQYNNYGRHWKGIKKERNSCTSSFAHSFLEKWFFIARKRDERGERGMPQVGKKG